MNATLAHAQRVYDQINAAAEQPAMSVIKLPGIAKYLAKVVLHQASDIALLESRVAALESQLQRKN